MIYLILAEPRTGKSQYAVSLGLKAKAEGKRVFVTNFNQTLEQRIESGFEEWPDATTWWDQMPHGAVWIIDEAQDVFPQRSKDKELPEWIKLLSKHGHHDLTIYFITQDAMQLDVTVRRNCNFTLLLSRPLGRKRANIYTFRGYQERPKDAWRRAQLLKLAESKQVFKYSKRYQRLYISASAHDHIKPRLPLRLLVLPAAAIFVAACMWYAWSTLKGQADSKDGTPAASVAAALTGADAPSAAAEAVPSAQRVMTAEEWGKQFTPRIEGVPWSAPAYDGFQVQDYPRPVCYESARFNECRCYTQQGSRLHMPQANCRMIVKNGYWDPYREPAEQAPGDAQGQESAAAPAPATATVSASPLVQPHGGFGADAVAERADVGEFQM